MTTVNAFSECQIDRIIEMAWEDRTSLEAIKFNLKLVSVLRFNASGAKASSFKLWRKRVQNNKNKHLQKRTFDKGRFKCSRQQYNQKKFKTLNYENTTYVPHLMH